MYRAEHAFVRSVFHHERIPALHVSINDLRCRLAGGGVKTCVHVRGLRGRFEKGPQYLESIFDSMAPPCVRKCCCFGRRQTESPGREVALRSNKTSAVSQPVVEEFITFTYCIPADRQRTAPTFSATVSVYVHTSFEENHCITCPIIQQRTMTD